MTSAQIKKKTYEELEREVILLRSEASQLRKENAQLKRSNKLLREKVKQQEKRIKQLEAQLKQERKEKEELVSKVNDLELQIEELRGMIFRKKRAKKEEKQEGKKTSRKKAKRSPESYRRRKPEKEDITDTVSYKIDDCPDCGTKLTKKKVVEQFVEDIAQLESLSKHLKAVKQEVIEKGYCLTCRKHVHGAEIRPQQVCLGEQVKRFIVYASIILRLSYSQVKTLLWETSRIKISRGEITNILFEQAEKLKPHVDEMKVRIQQDPKGQHYDETGWKVAKGEQGDYAWVMTGVDGKEAVFIMGRSRGKGNLEELKGEATIGITDDYPAYKNAFVHHQLCWAHPYRKIRDLVESKKLETAEQKACQRSYKYFGKLYKRLKNFLDKEPTIEEMKKEYQRYVKHWNELIKVTTKDPPKLVKIKNALAENRECYLTCLRVVGVPCDNNKAERVLRHIVIKRKISYGSKSDRAAEMMGTLCSAVLSLWWSEPNNFFEEYDKLLAA